MKIPRRLFVRASACAGLATALSQHPIFGRSKTFAPGIPAAGRAIPKPALLDPLYQLTTDRFSALMNQKFAIHVPEEQRGPVAVTLIEIKPLKSAEKTGQESFSLLFRGPVDRPLPQNIHPIEHRAIGKFSLLKVPVKTDRRGVYYEIIFNRLRLTK
jgi:hypothetical protein